MALHLSICEADDARAGCVVGDDVGRVAGLGRVVSLHIAQRILHRELGDGREEQTLAL